MSPILPHSSRHSKKTEDNGGQENTRLCITLCIKPGTSDLRTMHIFDAMLATLVGKSNSVIKVESAERSKHQRNKKQGMVYGLKKKKKKPVQKTEF